MTRSSGSSKSWLRRHVSDPYVKQAQAKGYRARSAFKLIEIDTRERFLKPGAQVIDLGAAPGGWAQVAAKKVQPGGRIIAVDLLDIAPIPGVMVLKGDFRTQAVRDALREALGARPADVVLSDLSPNLSGIANVDQARAAELVRAAAEFSARVLHPEGVFLVKIFQGEAYGELLAELKREFRTVDTRKPAASRGESRETYLVARGPKASDESLLRTAKSA